MQYVLGIMMIYLSTKVDVYLEGSPNVKALTVAFFILNFLAAILRQGGAEIGKHLRRNESP